MTGWLDHLIIVPIILPLMAAAGMLLLDERRRILKGLISLTVMTGILAAAILLLNESATGAADGGVGKYPGWLACRTPLCLSIQHPPFSHLDPYR